MFRFLLSVDESADHLNAQNEDGRSALMVAVDGNKLEVVKEILEHKNTDKDLHDRWGMTGVDIASVRRQHKMVTLLGGTMEERKIPAPVKVKGRPRTVGGSEPPILAQNKAPESLGARPKTSQLNRHSSQSLDFLQLTLTNPERNKND